VGNNPIRFNDPTGHVRDESGCRTIGCDKYTPPTKKTTPSIGDGSNDDKSTVGLQDDDVPLLDNTVDPIGLIFNPNLTFDPYDPTSGPFDPFGTNKRVAYVKLIIAAFKYTMSQEIIILIGRGLT
jgi:hypothetical protein